MLASAVAEEMQKVYKKELGPQPVPLTVPGEAINEEDVSLFFCFVNDTQNVLLSLSGRSHLFQGSFQKTLWIFNKVLCMRLLTSYP